MKFHNCLHSNTHRFPLDDFIGKHVYINSGRYLSIGVANVHALVGRGLFFKGQNRNDFKVTSELLGA